MKGYSAIQCGIPANTTNIDFTVADQERYIYANNPIKLQSITLTMTADIAAGETAECAFYRNSAANGPIATFTLDDTCKQYDSIVFDLQDYGASGGDCGDRFVCRVLTAATTSGTALISWSYILIESGEPVWNVGQTVDPAGNLVTGIKQKRNQISGDTTVIRDATPFYTRAS